MAFDVSDFRLDFPQFADPSVYSDAQLIRASERAALRVDETVWGDLYDEGISYLAAYLLSDAEISRQSSGNSVGGMRSASIAGEVSVSFSDNSSASSSSSNLSTNRYGQEFLELQQQVVIPVRVI
ncbi:MAG: DUF4054 domain-containing protein [Cyanobacteria bacterium P01_F01_bin.150]